MSTNEESALPRYADGSPVKVGDRVFIPSEQVQGLVDELVQSESEQRACNVSEPGVMFKAEAFGLLFIPNQILKQRPLERQA